MRVATTGPVCWTIHAERLHEEPTWAAVQWLLRFLARRDGRATFLVCPLRASAAGIDLAPRLRELADHGHEIGQHTHFYALKSSPMGRIAFEKRTDLSPDNVRRCLDHDLRVLREAGMMPRGFVSGAWAIDDTIFAWLEENGFAYDLSFRSFRLGYRSEVAARGDDRWAPFRHGRLLEIPTTANLATALRDAVVGRDRPSVIGGQPFRVLYVHDYDLVALRQRLALRAVDATLGSGPRIATAELEARSAAWLSAA